MIPFRVKKLTPTAKLPERNADGDLWDLFADGFESPAFKNNEWILDEQATVYPNSRVLVKTGIAIELPIKLNYGWNFKSDNPYIGEGSHSILSYAVADIRPRSDDILKKGLFIENKIIKGGELVFVAINHGHSPITIKKGQPLAQMLIKSIYRSVMQVVDN